MDFDGGRERTFGIDGSSWSATVVLPRLAVGLLAIALVGCSLFQTTRPPVPLASSVDLQRFAGDWYVIAFIPLFPEKNAHNAIERYAINPDGTIATTYRFRDGAFDGPLKVHHPRGFVRENTENALWGMQFFWPIKAEYRIAYLESDYSTTIIARSRRDYVWLMSRKPDMSDADYTRYRTMMGEMGYDLSELRRVPQQWPEPAEARR
jgi:apolipoprotein D and lipocalin family protein